MRYINPVVLLILVIVNHTKAVFQVINQPGLYQLGENVTYSPAGPNDVIFQITASNVEFDLGDRFITQNAANTQTGLIAIQVASGLSNVVIKSSTNGSIQNIRGTGIQVLSNCSRILLDSITTFSCDDRGIDFVGSPGNEITDSKIQNCNVIGCCRVNTASSAISLVSCNNLQVRNINLDANGPADPGDTFSCIELNASNGCTCDRIVMRGNTSNFVWDGFLLNALTNCTFRNCLCENNSAVSSASSYSINDCSEIVMQNCIAIGTICSGGQVVGFRFDTGCSNIFLYSCLVEAIVANVAIGFLDQLNTRITFIGCIARNNSGTVAMQGFLANTSTGSTFVNCIASDQVSSTGLASGFSLSSVDSLFMQDCLATRNNGTPLAGNSFGFLASGNTNPAFIHNVASYNGTVAADQFSGVAAGAVNNELATGVNSTSIGAWTNLGIT